MGTAGKLVENVCVPVFVAVNVIAPASVNAVKSDAKVKFLGRIRLKG